MCILALVVVVVVDADALLTLMLYCTQCIQLVPRGQLVEYPISDLRFLAVCLSVCLVSLVLLYSIPTGRILTASCSSLKMDELIILYRQAQRLP